MPVSFRSGDLFASGSDVLVNPVNCVGVQGAGLARQFRERFPDLDAEYREVCRDGRLKIGGPVLSRDGSVLWFPTKHHWRDRSRMTDVVAGLLTFVDRFTDDPRSWAFPALGCGLGGLDWRHVRREMTWYLERVAGDVMVYEP
ncbi:MAG: macro domain-containing protein [Thermomicrobiales bacterium]